MIGYWVYWKHIYQEQIKILRSELRNADSELSRQRKRIIKLQEELNEYREVQGRVR